MAPLSETLAEKLWTLAQPDLDPARRPPRPMLLQLAGVPLVGKSTLARHLRDRLDATVLHVENDAVRIHVTQALDRTEPAYDGQENLATYATAQALARRALAWGAHVLHDATNLTEADRQGGYRAADLAGRPSAVAFVTAPHEALAARAKQVSASRQRAFQKLGHRRPDPGVCTRPAIVLDGTRDPASNLDRLLGDPQLAYLQGTP